MNGASPPAPSRGRPFPVTTADCAELREFVVHFANHLRLKILCRLASGRACVRELVEATGEKQSNVSQQLKHLLDAHLVSRQRCGARVYYEIADPIALEVMDYLSAVAARHRRRWTTGA